MNPFCFFQSFFRRKLHLISQFFVRYIMVQLRYFQLNCFLNNLSLLDDLLRLVCLLMVHRYFIKIIDQQNVGTFFEDICSPRYVLFVLLRMEHQSIASFRHLLLFFVRPFYLSTRFLFVLILESSVISQLASQQPVHKFIPCFTAAFCCYGGRVKDHARNSMTSSNQNKKNI